VNEALKKIAYDALTTRPNFAYTLKEVEADPNTCNQPSTQTNHEQPA